MNDEEMSGTGTNPTRADSQVPLLTFAEGYRCLADSLPLIVWTAQPDGTIVFLNRQWYEYTGLSAERTQEEGWGSALHPDDRQQCLEFWSRALHRGETFEAQCRFRRASDGTYRWHTGRGVPKKTRTDAIIQWQGTWTDCDDRQRAEQAAVASKRLLRGIGENAADLVFACDMNRCLTFINSGARKLTGFGLESGDDMPLLRWLHAEDQARLAKLWDGLFHGRSFRDEEFRLLTATAESKWCISSCSPLLAEDGQQIGVQGHLRDISDRKRAEESFRSLGRAIQQILKDRVAARTAELEATNKELEAFAYSVSHDLRAPLRGIDGFSRALLDNHAAALSPQAQHYLQRICNAAQRMSVLIDELLRFSRLGRQALHRQAIATAGLVEQCLADLDDDRQDRQMEVVVGNLPPCEGDQGLLRQVWTNLLSNAFKYTRKKEQARIEIGCLDSGGDPAYYVRDNGAGFDMRHIDKLFGVFQRLHTAKDYEGIGIGLALVKRIVQRHGGRIWAEAEPDKGATFYFTVPPGLKT